jgi:hypothetical protein
MTGKRSPVPGFSRCNCASLVSIHQFIINFVPVLDFISIEIRIRKTVKYDNIRIFR